jgi:transposase
VVAEVVMGKTFRAWEPEQRFLLPPAVEEFVPRDHLAHFVRRVVSESLDLSRILECYDEERGYAPYHPVMMTALLLYAYSQGVYSSRRIAQACEQRLDFMAVTAMSRPDFRTISDFRKRHLKALAGLFQQVLALCRKAGLVKLGHVALDGTKIKANASKHKAMSYKRMKQVEPVLAAEVEKWLARAEREDAAEDEQFGAERRGDELPQWVADKAQRLEKIREAKAALEAEAREAAASKKDDGEGGAPNGSPPTPPDKAQRNFTDPESRIMKVSTGFEQCYNAQAAVDADSHVIVAQMVTNQPTDTRHLPPMVEQIKANTGRQAQEFSADAGYCSEANLTELNRRHIEGYVATGRQVHGTSHAAGDGPPGSGQRVVAMWRKLRRGGWRSRYRLRKGTVEPIFGVIKQARGFRQFLLRGAEKVQGEWSLVCTAQNLWKLAAAQV